MSEDETPDAAVALSLSNNNPTGINQHKNCPPKDDARIIGILRSYHRRGIVNRKLISEMLLNEHQVQMSEATVARRLKSIGLYGSSITTKALPEVEKRQIILDQMAKDPAGRQGPGTIKEGIAFDTAIHLTRAYIRKEMRALDPGGFAAREPSAKKIHRTLLVSLGPHHEWSGDGHDKLSEIGFPIWGIRDKWSGKWLGIWVLPNNRIKESVAYLYLDLLDELGGMPIQTTTDCGVETTVIFGLVNALREASSPHLALDELPAHRFMKSIYNITIERGWLRLRLQWGENVKVFWEAGSALYNPNIPKQRDLVRWLWPKLIQEELDTLKDRFNNHVVRFDKDKKLPSGVSPNVAFALPHKWGAENCLQPIDRALVRKLKEDLGGPDLVRFVSVDYATHAQTVYEGIGAPKLTFHNVWHVFQRMLEEL